MAPQDGAEKQDCEPNAAQRWLPRHGPAVAYLRCLPKQRSVRLLAERHGHVPLRATDHPPSVHYDDFVTDLPVTAARWRT
jgi:hypothetical protein